MTCTFNNKNYNLPAVNVHYILSWQSYPECFRKLPENFSETFLSRGQLVTTEFTMVLYMQRVQIYGCKHVFYFNKSRRVLLGKFPLEKNPPESISYNFDKFRKIFFLTNSKGTLSLRNGHTKKKHSGL